MKTLQKTLLASSILLALGSASTVSANPHNYGGSNSWSPSTQTATATATQGGDKSPQANEFSSATDNSDNSYNDWSNNSDNSDNSYNDWSDNSDNSDNSYNDNSDHSDNSSAGVSGTGASANNGSTASFSSNDSHDTDNSHAAANGDFSAAANNGGTAEVHMAIAESALNATVSGNHTNFNASGWQSNVNYEGNNNADGAVSGAAGVVNFSQNSGQQSLTQQNVTTQASLTVN